MTAQPTPALQAGEIERLLSGWKGCAQFNAHMKAHAMLQPHDEQTEVKLSAALLSAIRTIEAERLRDREIIERLTKCLAAIRDYKPKRGRWEVVYDEFAYHRMVRSFKDAARKGLATLGAADKGDEK